ncbi:MAG: hypothetical protein LBL66_10215 [Clostridiales bacterium]|jgi:hypothetical protein|nr:hypothetical protein [Clostridiales bacterium]
MKIHYDVSLCPHCGWKIKDDLARKVGLFILISCTAFMAVAWFIAIAILRGIFKVDIVKIGSPYVNCAGCGKPVRIGGKEEWGMLSDGQKRSWSFRRRIRVCYTLGGFILVFILMPLIAGVWGSRNQGDRTAALILLIVAIIFVVIIAIIYYSWHLYKDSPNIIMSQSDYLIVNESTIRTNAYPYLDSENNLEFPPIKIRETGHIIENKTMQQIRPQQASINSQPRIKQAREQRWAAQARVDQERLNRGDPWARQTLAWMSGVNALYESLSSFDNEQKSYSNSVSCVRTLTAELFLKNYFSFKEGNRNDIKDAIYTERPCWILDTLINLGLYIFETKNNVKILRMLAESNDSEFLSSKGHAQYILKQEAARFADTENDKWWVL